MEPGAGGGTRTPTLLAREPKSRASTSSATPASPTPFKRRLGASLALDSEHEKKKERLPPRLLHNVNPNLLYWVRSPDRRETCRLRIAPLSFLRCKREIYHTILFFNDRADLTRRRWRTVGAQATMPSQKGDMNSGSRSPPPTRPDVTDDTPPPSRRSNSTTPTGPPPPVGVLIPRFPACSARGDRLGRRAFPI